MASFIRLSVVPCARPRIRTDSKSIREFVRFVNEIWVVWFAVRVHVWVRYLCWCEWCERKEWCSERGMMFELLTFSFVVFRIYNAQRVQDYTKVSFFWLLCLSRLLMKACVYLRKQLVLCMVSFWSLSVVHWFSRFGISMHQLNALLSAVWLKLFAVVLLHSKWCWSAGTKPRAVFGSVYVQSNLWITTTEGTGRKGLHSQVVPIIGFGSMENLQCIQLFLSQTLFDFKKLVSRSICLKFSGKTPCAIL